MKKIIAVLTMTLLCVVALCACTPSADALKKKYEDEGYAVTVAKAEDAEKYGVESEDVDYVFTATKGLNSVMVIGFKNGDKASELYDKAQKKEGLFVLVESKKSGNAVAIGTKDAVDLF